ncbi:MAG: substrate-binding domain-containing protein [Dehalococcoidia bacterium]|nr:substrate-binding domain-containing protein [Dehalococcoidia bacterium]
MACAGDDESAGELGGEMILATTTSTYDSGLLDVLVPVFEEQYGTNLKVVSVGTGAALEMAGNGNADTILVHAPAAEQQYIDSGDLVEGELVMHNDFVIVGSPDDPAGVAGLDDIDAVMGAIAETGPFISRGDDSGTNKKELGLWEAAGVDPASVTDREETGQGMGATLNVANQKSAYTLTDRATYLSLRDNLDGLEIVFEGATSLLNIYHVYLVNPEEHDTVKPEHGRAWVDFMVSDEAQALIEDLGVDEFGEPLFVPDAGKSVEDLGGWTQWSSSRASARPSAWS